LIYLTPVALELVRCPLPLVFLTPDEYEIDSRLTPAPVERRLHCGA
jgi:hypothetical protein